MINRYTQKDKKIRGNDLNALIDSYNNQFSSVSDFNSESYLRKHAFYKDIPRLIKPAQILIDQSTSADTTWLLVRKFNWVRNGYMCEPTTNEAWDVGIGGYNLDQYFTHVELTSTDWSTAQNTSYNGMVYISAVLSSNTATKVTTMDVWRSENLESNPAIAPKDVVIIKTKIEDFEDGKLISHGNTQVDSCIRLLGAVKIDPTGGYIDTYQYNTGDFSDEWEPRPWDVFDIVPNGSSFDCYMTEGYISYKGGTAGVGNYYGPSLGSYRGLDLVSFSLPNAYNYVYADWATCDTAGSIGTSVTIGVSNSIANVKSNSTSYKELLYTYSISSGQIDDYKRYRDTNLDVYHLISDIAWDRTGNSKLQYRRSYCDYWTDITEAVDCPT